MVALFAGSSSAADMPVKAPVYKPPIADWWDGFYVGVNLGYSSAKWDTSSNQRVFNFETLTASPRLNGTVGGAQFGLNVQTGNRWVLGFEADLQRTGEKASQTWTDPGLPAIVPPPASAAAATSASAPRGGAA